MQGFCSTTLTANGRSLRQDVFVLAAFRVGIGADRRRDTAGVNNCRELGCRAGYILRGRSSDAVQGADCLASRVEVGSSLGCLVRSRKFGICRLGPVISG